MRIFKALLIACILFLVQSINSFGVLKTFNGSINTNWNNTGNWTPIGIPLFGDSVVVSANCTINTNSDSCYALMISNGVSLTINGPYYLKVAGNFYGQGDLVLNTSSRFLIGGNNNHIGKLIAGPTSTVEYFGGNQQVQGGLNYKYYDLIISGSGNKTLAANDTINNSLNIKSGSFVMGGPGVNLLLINGPTTIASGASFIFGNAGIRVVTMMNNLSAAPGSTLDMAAPGLAHVLRLAGPNNIVANFITTNGSGSRVSYINNGGPQTIFPSNNYQQLEIKTAGPGNANLSGNIGVNDGISIVSGSTLNANNYTISILKNDFVCDGIFNPGTSTVQFTGGGTSQIIGATNPINFFKLTLNNITTVNAAQVISVADNDSIGANSKLDLGLIVGHNVGNVFGSGTIALSAPNGGNTSFPSGNFSGFMSFGIIEYNSPNSYTIDQTNFAASNYGVLNITGGGVKTLNNNVPNIMNLVVQGSTQFDLTHNGSSPINISNFNCLGTVNFYGSQSITVFGFNNNFNFNNYSSSLFIPNSINNPSMATFTNDGYIQLNGDIINSGVFKSTPGSGSTLELTGYPHNFSGNPIQVENLKLTMGGQTLSLGTNLRVNAALNFADDGNVILNSSDLLLSPTATIINTGTGSLGPIRMIESNGVVGPGSLIKEGNIATDFQTTYPLGINGVYTPLTITNSTLSTSGVGSIRMKSITHPTSPYGYANYYIQLASQNINSVSDFQFKFQFGNVGDYHTPTPNKLYRYAGTVPYNVVSPYTDISTVTYGVVGSGNTNIDGDWRFELLSQPPLVTSFSPNPVCVGDTLKIKGSSFLNTDSVYVNNKKATFVIQSDTLLNVSVPATTSGKLKIFNAFGADSSKSVSINITTVNAGPAQSVCPGVSVSLTGTITGATKARWIGGIGTYVPNDSTLTATYQPASGENGTNVTLTLVPIDGCLPHPSSNLTITVQSKPGAAISPAGPTTICPGGSKTFNGTPTGGGYAYQWYNNGSAIGGATTASFTAISAGNYTLKVTNTTTTCTDTSTAVLVTLSPSPTVTATSTQSSICLGQTTGLIATGSNGTGPYTYSWASNSTLSSTSIANPIASPTSATTYSVSVTDNLGCVSASPATVTISVNPAATAIISVAGPSSICSSTGGAININFTGVGPWDFSYNDGANNYSQTKIYSSSYTIPVYPLSSTNYQLNSVNDSVCGTGTTSGSANFNVSPSPSANAGPDLNACPKSNIPISGQVSTSTFTWSSSGSGSFTNPSGLGGIYVPAPIDSSASTIEIYLTTGTSGPCPPVTDTMIVYIIFPPLSNAIVGPGGTICGNNNGTLVVTNAQAGINYSLMHGTIGYDVQQPANGTVSLTVPGPLLNPGWDTLYVRASNFCGSVDLTPSVIFKKGLPASINIYPTFTVLCAGSVNPVELFADLAPKYQWYWNNSMLVGDTLEALFPVIPGDYKVIAYDSLNCPGVQSNIVTITSMLNPITVSVQSTGSNYIDLVSSFYTNDMQWYGNGKAIYGTNSNTLRVYYNGEYFVSYTENDCRQVSSPFIINNPNFDLLAKKNFLSNDSIIFIEPPLEVNDDLWIYPNPAKDNFSLSYIGSSNEFILVDIIGPLGERVYHESVQIKPGTNELKFEGLNLNAGLYQVILVDGDKKLVKGIQITQ